MNAHLTEPTTFVLVHGAWHDHRVWWRTDGALRARGVTAVALDLPSCGDDALSLGDLRADAAALEALVERTPGRLLICAHSYGGMVLSEARLPDRVARLVYLAAFLPLPGVPLVAHFEVIPPYAVPQEDGTVRFAREMAREVLYHDVPEPWASEAIDRLHLHGLGAITTPTTRASWQEHPTTYVVCTGDRTIPVPLQRRFAERVTSVRELATSHSPMLSAPDALADLLVELAR
jgi:pimeloyl-ACP methyl ester carboxylesterase